MEKYLHLKEAEYVNTWVNGGQVPLGVASDYFDVERTRTSTPDEGMTYYGTAPVYREGNRVYSGGSVFENVNVVEIDNRYIDCGGPDGRLFSGIVDFRSSWDGAIFCCSNRYKSSTGLRLGKLFCVKILDIEQLKYVLDEQVGLESQSNRCSYTRGIERDVFLKSHLGKWQDEYRLYWTNLPRQTVQIPSGLAERFMETKLLGKMPNGNAAYHVIQIQ